MLVNKKVFVILILLVVIFAGCQKEEAAAPKPVCESLVNKAFLATVSAGGERPWVISESNKDKITFPVFIINYGNLNAQNVVVKCRLNEFVEDPDSDAGKMVLEAEKNIGMVDSVSVVAEEILAPLPAGLKGVWDYIGGCCIASCDNCVNLDKRLPSELSFC